MNKHQKVLAKFLVESADVSDEIYHPIRNAAMDIIKARAELDKIRKLLNQSDSSGWKRYAKEYKRLTTITSELTSILEELDDVRKTVSK